jgi:hypothetical protein
LDRLEDLGSTAITVAAYSYDGEVSAAIKVDFGERGLAFVSIYSWIGCDFAVGIYAEIGGDWVASMGGIYRQEH